MSPAGCLGRAGSVPAAGGGPSGGPAPAADGAAEGLRRRESGATEEVVVGRIGRARGLAGDVVVDLGTDEPDRRFAPGAVLRRPAGGVLHVQAAGLAGGRFVVRFAEAADRTAAERLSGETLSALVDVAERPAEPEEYYDRHLVGLVVRTTAGCTVGRVGQVIHGGAQDLLLVHRADADPALVPFVTAIVVTVDLDAGELVLDPPAGLLD